MRRFGGKSALLCSSVGHKRKGLIVFCLVFLVCLAYSIVWYFAGDEMFEYVAGVTLESTLPVTYRSFLHDPARGATISPSLRDWYAISSSLSNNVSTSPPIDMEQLLSRWKGIIPYDTCSPNEGSTFTETIPGRQRIVEANHPVKGTFILVRSDGTSKIYGDIERFNRRYAWIPFIRDAASRYIRSNVVFFLGYDDNDIFYYARVFPNCRYTQLFKQIVLDFPNLFFLHWDPVVFDEVSGALGPRMVIIPDYEMLRERKITVPDGFVTGEFQRSGVLGAGSGRARVFSYKGSCTGTFSDYRLSDRGLLVRLVNDNTFLEGLSNFKLTTCTLPGDVVGKYRGAFEKRTEMNKASLYVFDIDGNSNSWQGSRWKLASGSVTVKVASPFVQWWYPLMCDGEHLMLLSLDNSVQHIERWLTELAVNATTIEGEVQRVAQIAARGALFAHRHLTRSAAIAVLYENVRSLRLFEESPRDWRIRTQCWRGGPAGKTKGPAEI